MALWYFFPDDIPADGDWCYIRVTNGSGKSFLAQWNLSSQVFTSYDNSISFPVYTVSKWQAINPALVYGIGDAIIGITFYVS